jgi:molecular chaperone DnaK
MHLGIDLGTSNSAVVGNFNSQLRVFKTSDGSDLLPSVIYMTSVAIGSTGAERTSKHAYHQTMLRRASSV